jgi:hypothetical protein
LNPDPNLAHRNKGVASVLPCFVLT